MKRFLNKHLKRILYGYALFSVIAVVLIIGIFLGDLITPVEFWTAHYDAVTESIMLAVSIIIPYLLGWWLEEKEDNYG